MKQVLCVLMATILIVSMAACGSQSQAPSAQVTSPAAQQVQNQPQPETPQASGDSAAHTLDFPDLGISFPLTGAWLELEDHLLTVPVYGSEIDPVSGVMFDFATDEAIAQMNKLIADGESDGGKIEDARWTDSKRLFAVAFVKTGQVPMDTVLDLVGGPEKEANVVEMGVSGDTTFYFCTYPFIYEDTEALSDSSKAHYNQLVSDLETAKSSILLSQPEDRPEVESGATVFFQTTDLDGNKVTSDIFQDHTLTLLNIWGSFCEPCMEEMPDLEAISKEFADKDVAIVGVLGDALDRKGEFDEDTVDLAKTVLKSKGVTYLNIAMCPELLEAVPSDTYPTSVLIDSNGSVVGKAIYGSRDADQYRQLIQNALDTLVK
ncbi:MAG: TlpA family protein disulfide reductase [Clostridiales bacterium]|nr:TlpA family protein disulfide reductase [Clostridiales bacterium]